MRKWWHLAAVAAGAIACRSTIANADIHHALRNTAHTNALQQVAFTDTCIPWRAERPDSIYLLQAMAPPSGDAWIAQTDSNETEGFYIDELGFCNDPTCPCHDSVIDSLQGSTTEQRPVLEADSFEEALEATAGPGQGYTADNPASAQSKHASDQVPAIERAEDDGFADEELYGYDELYGYEEDEGNSATDRLTGNDVVEEMNESSDGLFDDPFGWEYGADAEIADSDAGLEQGWIHQNLVNDPYPVEMPATEETADAVRPEATNSEAEPTWIDYGEFDFEDSAIEVTDQALEGGEDASLYEEEWLREMADEEGMGLYDAGMTEEELREAYGEEPLAPEMDVDEEYRGTEADRYGEYDEEELYEDWRSNGLPPTDEIEAPDATELDEGLSVEAGVSTDEFASGANDMDEMESFEPYSYDDFYSPEEKGYEDYGFQGYEQGDAGLSQEAEESSDYGDGQYYDDMDYYDIEYYDATYDRYEEPAVDPLTYDSAEQMRQYESSDPEARDEQIDTSEEPDLHVFYPGEDWSDYANAKVKSTRRSGVSALFDPQQLLQIVSTMPYGDRIGALVEQAVRMLEKAAPDAYGVATAELANIQSVDADADGAEIERLIEDGGEFACPYCEIRGWEYEALSR